MLSLPLLTPDGVFGAMNVYAHGKDAFDERAERIGELFATPAAIAVPVHASPASTAHERRFPANDPSARRSPSAAPGPTIYDVPRGYASLSSKVMRPPAPETLQTALRARRPVSYLHLHTRISE